ncbi:ATP phosphoribosyltransferase regulatory subunit [Deinococcus irradiatisoli]|uniref:ATP phosphoribosyltransferase regulatory subunit n=1 Tax=Deinococcus irradiatisoli TaxID=2202254 RepID=A0A2Z3JTJ5_9DEIO|nr:ATP phosphoribosyltransferase regulatory subunit [Deinococcus irradiatisoli]AWN23954.1 ATP phosphoribosyltransferase regulatory subunit [Deinococcus irradiatisoli]
MRLPEGTRDVLPPEWAWREYLRSKLSGHFAQHGYRGVDVPTLEFQDASHPQDATAFKLIDRDGSVLALRSEFTTAIGQLARRRFPQGPFPLRLQYAGRLWLRGQASELGHLREFTQVGVELIGIRSPQADAELLEVALSALAAVGVPAQLEVGHPGFVDGLLEDAGVVGPAREALHGAMDRKSGPDLSAGLAAHRLGGELGHTLHAVMDLYGGPEVLAEARALPLGERARAALDDLTAIAEAFGPQRLLFDLGMSRRYGYYSGYTFRAYVEGHAQSVLGGGRYGGRAGEWPGAGFAVGLERLTEVAARHLPPEREAVLALDEAGVRHAQALGLVAERAWTDDVAELERYARARGLKRYVRGEMFSEVGQ